MRSCFMTKPVAVPPILCDQFFWKLVEELGLCAVTEWREAGAVEFEQAVSMAFGEKCREQFEVFGERGRAQGSGN